MSPPALRVRDRLPQLLQIVAAGPDVARIAADQPVGVHLEETVPDVVARWVQAVNVGLLGSERAAPARCAAELVESARAPNGEQTWLVKVTLADRGAFRVLANLLAARELDSVTLTTALDAADESARPPLLAAADLSFPRGPVRTAFTVARAELARAGRQRGVQISFANPPADEVVDALVEALDLWADLIVLGGYPLAGQDPRASGALPDGALLYDAVTVTQTFTEAFDCDDAAFEAVISLTEAFSARGARPSRVDIR